MSVEAAIQARLTSDATLAALTTGGIWQMSPPQGQSRPYLVWQKIQGDAAYTFTQKVRDVTLWQFMAWAEDTTSAAGVDTARAMIDRVETVLFDAPLSITGRTLLYCRKAGDTPDLQESEPGGESVYGKGIEVAIEYQ